MERHKSFCSFFQRRKPAVQKLTDGKGEEIPVSSSSIGFSFFFFFLYFGLLNVTRQFSASSRSQSANTKHTQGEKERGPGGYSSRSVRPSGCYNKTYNKSSRHREEKRSTFFSFILKMKGNAKQKKKNTRLRHSTPAKLRI